MAPVIVFKSFDGHVQSALAQMAVIILAKRPRRTRRMQQEQQQVEPKEVQNGSEDGISNLLLITCFSFQKESHFIAQWNNICYIIFSYR